MSDQEVLIKKYLKLGETCLFTFGLCQQKICPGCGPGPQNTFRGENVAPKNRAPQNIGKMEIKKKKKKKIKACICYPVFPIVTPCYPAYSRLAGWLAGWLSRSIDRLRPSPPEYPESHDFWLVLAGCHG